MGLIHSSKIIILAFLGFAVGVFTCGLLGFQNTLLLIGQLFIISRAYLKINGKYPPSCSTPFIFIIIIGAIRFETTNHEQPNSISELGEIATVLRIDSIIERNKFRTIAEATVVGGDKLLGERMRVIGTGFLKIVRGDMIGVRGRLVPPSRKSDTVSPLWYQPPSLPSLFVNQGYVRLDSTDKSFLSMVDSLRVYLSEYLRMSLSESASDLAIAVLVGEGRGIDPYIRLELSSLGTSHILAVSGIHVMAFSFIIGLIVIKLIGPVLCRITQRINLVVIHLVISSISAIFVTLLAGMTPSSIRAASLFVVMFICRILHRPQHTASAISLVGLGNLLISPSQLFSLSFILSYFAVLSLVIFTPILFRLITYPKSIAFLVVKHRYIETLVKSLCGSFSVSITTTPIVFLAFNNFSLVAPFTNLFVIPLMTIVIMPCALILLLLTLISLDALLVISPLIDKVLSLFLDSQIYLANMFHLGLIPISLWGMCFLVGLPTFVAIYLASRKISLSLVYSFGILLLTISFFPNLFNTRDGELVIHALDVGKGDAILISCPSGKKYLLDSGEKRKADLLVKKLIKYGVREIEGVIITHADEDHSGGLEEVAKTFMVSEVVTSCPSIYEEPLQSSLSRLALSGIPYRCVTSGGKILHSCGVDTEVLWPPSKGNLKDNYASLVIIIFYQNKSILFPGDLPGHAEIDLVQSRKKVSADVLFLSHHGSKTSNKEDFLFAVNPTFVVISGSTTRSKAKELDKDVVERVSKLGSRLFETSQLGDISIFFNKNKIQIAPLQKIFE